MIFKLFGIPRHMPETFVSSSSCLAAYVLIECSGGYRHTLNLLEAREVLSVTERTATIGRIRTLTSQVAERKANGFMHLKSYTFRTSKELWAWPRRHTKKRVGNYLTETIK